MWNENSSPRLLLKKVQEELDMLNAYPKVDVLLYNLCCIDLVSFNWVTQLHFYFKMNFSRMFL